MDLRLPKVIRFAIRVLRDFFFHNHGLLLTSAVAFNMMLSLIPLSAVIMVGLSQLLDQRLLMDSLASESSLIAPGFAPSLSVILESFLRHRSMVGWIGALSLLFFSSMAFRVLEDSIAILFHRPLPALKRKFWVSALMPYLFILIVAAGIILITAANALIDAQSRASHGFPFLDSAIQKHLGLIIYLTGVFGLVLLFTLLYKIMPMAKIPLRRALAGGFTAAFLWEITRHLLVAYYTRVSLINVLYGSMATIIIVLLTMETGALILLLGAQVIADLQKSTEAGIPWHEETSAPLDT